MKTMRSIFVGIVMIGILVFVFSNCENSNDSIFDEAYFAKETDEYSTEDLDELTKFGSIKITFEGIQSNDEFFKKTEEFKFIKENTTNLFNTAFTEDKKITFDMERFLKVPKERYQEPFVNFGLTAVDLGTPNQEFTSFYFNIHEYALIFDDFTFFEINGSINTSSSNITDFNIANFDYNKDTGALSFLFIFYVKGMHNATGYDLLVSGEVDVIVEDNFISI
ncbi:hypothetical protein [Aquimarina pacifica]|uniref:hypothetical protein n=1 Tax=Aquimarina pacifica TaxID=1296415 RepID=UPI000470E691|nr:hypothetical protein [Aquimarina pacifica]